MKLGNDSAWIGMGWTIGGLSCVLSCGGATGTASEEPMPQGSTATTATSGGSAGSTGGTATGPSSGSTSTTGVAGSTTSSVTGSGGSTAVAVATGVGGGAASVTSSSTGGSGGMAEPTAWYYVETETSAMLTHLYATDQVVPIESQVDPYHDVFPWSPDGSRLARVENGEVVFYNLRETATVTARYPAPHYTTVLGWIPQHGALLEGERDLVQVLGAMSVEGTDSPLGEEEDAAAPFYWSIAPDGNHVLWSNKSDGDDPSYNIWQCRFVQGQPQAPALLTEGLGSPMLDATWSPTSDWLAFGIALGPRDGIHFWNLRQSEIVTVNPEGTSYTPLFSFNENGSKFVMYLSGENGGLYGVGRTEGGLSGGHVIKLGGVSPAEWTGYDRLMYVDVDSGVLQTLSGDGSPGPSIPFSSYSSGCDVVWLSETDFIHNGCSHLSGLTHGSIVDGAIVTREIAPDGLLNLALSPNDACLLQWDRQGLRVGQTLLDPFTTHPIATSEGELDRAEISPDNSSVVWTENGTHIYRMELSDCAPSGEPILVHEANAPIRQALFASRPRR